MPAMSGLTMMVWQSTDPLSGRDMHLLMIFAGVIAGSILLAAVGLIATALIALKMGKKVEALSNSVEQKIMPILAKTNSLMEDLGPKIRSVSENVEQMSYTVREKVVEIGATVTEINRTVNDVNYKARVHVDKAHGLVSDALATTAEVQAVVQEGIRMPLKQIAGVIAGVKVGLETLVARSPFGSRVRPGPYDL